MRSDREWFVPVAAIVTVETLLWCAAYLAGDAARPMIVTYGSLALTFFTLALCFYVSGCWSASGLSGLSIDWSGPRPQTRSGC